MVELALPATATAEQALAGLIARGVVSDEADRLVSRLRRLSQVFAQLLRLARATAQQRK